MSTQQISQSSQINKQKLNAEVEQQPHVLNHVERKEVADRSEFNANLYDSSKLHIQRKDRSGHLSEIKEGQDLHHVEDKQQNLRDDFDKQKFVSNKKMESISQAQNSDPNREKMLNEIEQNKFQLEHHAIDQDRSNPNLGLYNDQTQKHMMVSKEKNCIWKFYYFLLCLSFVQFILVLKIQFFFF